MDSLRVPLNLSRNWPAWLREPSQCCGWKILGQQRRLWMSSSNCSLDPFCLLWQRTAVKRVKLSCLPEVLILHHLISAYLYYLDSYDFAWVKETTTALPYFRCSGNRGFESQHHAFGIFWHSLEFCNAQILPMHKSRWAVASIASDHSPNVLWQTTVSLAHPRKLMGYWGEPFESCDSIGSIPPYISHIILN